MPWLAQIMPPATTTPVTTQPKITYYEPTPPEDSARCLAESGRGRRRGPRCACWLTHTSKLTPVAHAGLSECGSVKSFRDPDAANRRCRRPLCGQIQQHRGSREHLGPLHNTPPGTQGGDEWTNRLGATGIRPGLGDPVPVDRSPPTQPVEAEVLQQPPGRGHQPCPAHNSPPSRI